MRKNLPENLPDADVRDLTSRRAVDLQLVQREPRAESRPDDSVQMRAERDSLLWILRIVRREVNWSDDSPTLRMIEQALARA